MKKVVEVFNFIQTAIRQAHNINKFLLLGRSSYLDVPRTWTFLLLAPRFGGAFFFAIGTLARFAN